MLIRAIKSADKLLRNYCQNTDTLEQVAGIEKVFYCHGSSATASCMVCKAKVDAEGLREDIINWKLPHLQPSTAAKAIESVPSSDWQKMHTSIDSSQPDTSAPGRLPYNFQNFINR